ncbi:hypothetical protein [Solidesulfovibrio alcoholivorans]|uniref:hypothetical protein n=1 Tax=Solidesulfovibrio alcoholivorans TaxID=81406 RepID=UPI000496E009|nr:hypothetical protein [Solidesulfovibrio alcoholivorans]
MRGMMLVALGVVVVCAALCGQAAAAGKVQVTPQMRKVLTEKLTQQCLAQEAEFARKGYTRAQTAAICRCAMQQTGALLNSNTVDYILTHGVMPPDMQRKVASATGACIKAHTGKPAP